MKHPREFQYQRLEVGPIPIAAVPADRVCSALEKLRLRRGADYVCFCEANLWTRGVLDRKVREVLQSASMVLPDGISMIIGARLLGQRLPTRVPGPSALLQYCQYGVAKNVRHFFYGGAPGVAERLAEKLRQQIPGVQIVGTYSPPFGPLVPEEERRVRAILSSSEADVIWVGLGAPKQEQWMYDHRDQLDIPLMLGVGAAFDFHSGHRKWAPLWVRRMGMEWMFRMMTGGRKTFLRYVVVLPKFLCLISLFALRRLTGTVKEPDRTSKEEAV